MTDRFAEEDVSTVLGKGESGSLSSKHEEAVTVPEHSSDRGLDALSPEDKRISRRMVLKFDLVLLPILTLLYLFNALDKGNISNAKTATSVDPMTGKVGSTFMRDLHLTETQWRILVMVFYIPFCLSGPVMVMIVKKYGPHRVLPILACCFGATALFTPLCTSFSDLFAIRWFLGIFESPILAGVLTYLSYFYRRSELAGRLGLFYGASSIASGFSGLLAYGVFHIKHSHYSSWKFLFWVEGGATFVIALLAFLILPGSPQTAHFLSAREKEIARIRIEGDSSSVIDEKLDIRDAFRPFTDVRMLAWAIISFSYGVPLASVNNFSAQIVNRLGYDALQTNLYTVYPSIVATAFLVALTQSSDHFRERTYHISTALAVGLVGWIMLGALDPLIHKRATYAAVFFVSMGAFASSVLVASWYSNNMASENRRAAQAGVMIALANSAGLVSTNVFIGPPRYSPAIATSAVFAGLTLVSVLTWGTYQRQDNSRRNREQKVRLRAQDVDTIILGEGWKHPSFRWFV